MGVRRDTKNRLILYRECAVCGQRIVVTADTPFVRQVEERDEQGRRHQYTRFYCTESCKTMSYKHLFDGKREDRKRIADKNRDIREKNRRYYAAHAEQERIRQRERYWSRTPEENREINRFNREKMKLKAM